MADKNVKLTATIDANSKPLQQELDKAKQSADRTGQSMKSGMEKAAENFDRAGQSARNMGEAGRTAGISIGQAIKHPINTTKALVAQLKDGALALMGLGNAAKNASKDAQTTGQALGAIVGIGSKMAIIAKGFQALGNIIREAIVEPLRDGYKEIMRLADMRYNANSTIYGAQADKWQNAKKALMEYYSLYQKANAPGATNMDKERERAARKNLGYHGIEVDPNGLFPMESQIRESIDNAQAQYVKALESKLDEANRAMEAADKALKKASDPKVRLLYGSKGAYETEIARLQDVKDKRRADAEKIQAELVEAKKHQTPGEDFSMAVAAEAADKLADEYDKQTEALKNAQAKEDEAQKRLTDAENKRADIERRLADESTLEAMHHTQDVISHNMGRFGFNLDDYDEENLDESVKERIQRRRNVRLDARIGAKLERLRQGSKVHFTPQEERRINELRDLRTQSKDLSAEAKAMEAARKQESAAEALEAAAGEISTAAEGLNEAKHTKEELEQSIGELEKAKQLIDNERSFFEATAHNGVGGSPVPDYGSVLEQIRTLLDNQSKKIYVVK